MIRKLISNGVEARKINEIIDFLNTEFTKRGDALQKITERYASIPDSFVAKLAREALLKEEPKDETDVLCPCGDVDCSRPFGHPEDGSQEEAGI